jgi:hypothetical protein
MIQTQARLKHKLLPLLSMFQEVSPLATFKNMFEKHIRLDINLLQTN